MGVLGAFLFAAQMINFTIPATGSSGHLGGGLLLTILLGPCAGFLTIASVLVVQALFFADGGLLALGCNMFNMGFIPAFLVYPLIYRQIVGCNPSQRRLTVAIMISAIAGLQLGPFGVVLETVFSGISSLPFSTFVLLMQPIHLAIGTVEGCVTVAVASFVFKARPEILQMALEASPIGNRPVRNLLVVFLAAAVVTGGVVSLFASKNPDGLEWAIAKVTGKEELKGSEKGVHAALASLQEKTAFLPDYNFKKLTTPKNTSEVADGAAKKEAESNLGTSIAGVVGVMLTLVLAYVGGSLLKRRNQPA
jgi:cobalt/nickel transport system permease protein